VKGKEANGVGSQQSSAWLGTVHPVLLQSLSADPHSKKASTWLNWHPRRYKRTRPFRWKTESGFCACAVTFRFHSTHLATAPQHIPTQHDLLPQHLVCKYELNCEYSNITLASNKAPWWWSEKIETCRNVLKCFIWNYMCIRWLINRSD